MRCQNEVSPRDYTLTTLFPPTTPRLHTKSAPDYTLTTLFAPTTRRLHSRLHRDYTRSQNEVRADYTATTHEVTTKSGPTTPRLHTKSERSQGRLHRDYTRSQTDGRTTSERSQPEARQWLFPSRLYSFFHFPASTHWYTGTRHQSQAATYSPMLCARVTSSGRDAFNLSQLVLDVLGLASLYLI